ncbi:MAG: C-terminal binding protein [Candidatus Bipolaricaulis sp.]|nr:C-terminal binding protein [Candidatus Bipolaricaulis sp.]
MNRWKVVITDYEYGNVDIERATLERAGATVEDHQCKTAADVVAVASDADVVINQYAPITREVIEHLSPTCRAIAQYGIGVDTIDVDAATEHGIIVINVPSYCEDDVAEHALALLLSLARRVTFYDREVRKLLWDYSTQAPITRLRGQTLGLVGFGKIARKVAEKASGFSFRTVVYDPLVDREVVHRAGAESVSLSELVRRADFISIHVPLNAHTRHLIGEAELRLMKPTAVLVNVSRGAVVDQDALVRALAERRIRAAGLDVFRDEPPGKAPGDDHLLRLENTIFTPHVGWYSEQSIVDLRQQLADDVVRVLGGKDPEGFVNRGVPAREGRR